MALLPHSPSVTASVPPPSRREAAITPTFVNKRRRFGLSAVGRRPRRYALRNSANGKLPYRLFPEVSYVVPPW